MRAPRRLVGALGLAAVSALLVLPPAARGAAIVESAYSRVAHSGSAWSATAREGRGPVSAGLTELQPPPQPPEQADSSSSPHRDAHHGHAQDRNHPNRGANLRGREMISTETRPSDLDIGTEGLDEGVGGNAAYQDSQRPGNLTPDLEQETSKTQHVSYKSESADDSYESDSNSYRQPITKNVYALGAITHVDASQYAGAYSYSAIGQPASTQEQDTSGIVQRIGPGGDGGQIIDGLTPPSESDPPPYWEEESYGNGREGASETEAHYESPEEREGENTYSSPAQSRQSDKYVSFVKHEEVPTYSYDDSSKVDTDSYVLGAPHNDDDDNDDNDDDDDDDDDNDDNDDDDNNRQDDNSDNEDDNGDSDDDSEEDDDVGHTDATTTPVTTDDVSSASARQEDDQRSAADRTEHDKKVKEEPEHQKGEPKKQQEESRLKRPSYAGYYGLGRKLWYVPLYFSVYYIIYLTALVIKSIARHKIQYPETEKHHGWKEHHGWDKRSLADAAATALVRTVHRALREAVTKYD